MLLQGHHSLCPINEKPQDLFLYIESLVTFLELLLGDWMLSPNVPGDLWWRKDRMNCVKCGLGDSPNLRLVAILDQTQDLVIMHIDSHRCCLFGSWWRCFGELCPLHESL